MTTPEPAVHIGLQAIYKELLDLKPLVQQCLCEVRALRDELADHETRLRGLESNRLPWGLIGGLVGIGALVVAVLGLLLQ